MAQFFEFENLNHLYENSPDSITFAHLASRLIEQENHQEAIDLCKKGLHKHPQYAFGRYILGLAYYQIKNYTDAKKELELSLAYDPENPKGWEILSTVNEILNLSDDASVSNLNSYLIDVFNEEASNNFIPEDQQSSATPPESPVEQTPLGTGMLDSSEGQSEKELDELIDTSIVADDTSDDFEKTLDDVFVEKAASALESAEEPLEEESEAKTVEEEGIDLDKLEKGKDDIISAEEFTSAIDSFFSEYEEKEQTGPVREEAPADETDKTEQEPKEELSPGTEEEIKEDEQFEELKLDESEDEEGAEMQEAGPEEIPDIEVPQEEKAPEPESEEEEKVSESELMDFSSVVSDIISEEGEGEKTDINLEEQKAAIEEETPSSEMEEVEEIEEETEIIEKEKETINLPDITEEDKKTEQVPPEESTEVTDESEKGSAKFGRPPILSPTLGEIYIAQGRFEEAIDVFKQLLEKDPDSARFKRKIQDLEVILQKKKSQS